MEWFESHKNHPIVGWYSSKVGLWVSVDGKECRMMDYSTLTKKEKYKGQTIITLPCNLSNHGCKETRRVFLKIKVTKFWKPKTKRVKN